MIGATPARWVLAAGFVAASFAYGSWVATRTALDPTATGEAADVLLAAPAVREGLGDDLGRHVAGQLARGGVDPTTARAVEAALADPRFVAAFADAVTAVHRNLVDGTPGPVTIDTVAVTASVRDAVARVDPDAAAQMSAAEPIRLQLGDANLPQVGSVADRVRATAALGTLLALALLAAGVAMHPSPRTGIATVGRRVAMLAVGPVVGFVVVPWLLEATGHDAARVVGAVVDVYGRRVLPSAFVLAVGGIGTWLVARAWPKPAPANDPPRPRPRRKGPGTKMPRLSQQPRRPTEKLYL